MRDTRNSTFKNESCVEEDEFSEHPRVTPGKRTLSSQLPLTGASIQYRAQANYGKGRSHREGLSKGDDLVASSGNC